MRRLVLIALGVAAVVAFVAIGEAADHRDAPLVLDNPRLDINDLYVFRSPVNGDNVVIALTVHPALTPAAGPLFESEGLYDIKISTDADFVADRIIRCVFDAEPVQGFTITGLPGGPISGTVTDFAAPAPIVSTSGAVTAFAGVRDDPFFFDLDGFTAITTNPYVPTDGLRGPGLPAPPVDFFETLNVAAIVIEVPITMLTNELTSDVGSIQVWAETFQRETGDS